MHITAQRLLKPRTPRDCLACRLSCALSSVVGSASSPVRPWREMKSRRGAPKRVHTEGFACVLFSSIDTGDDLLLVPDKQGALTSTVLFPAKGALNRDHEEVLKNSASRLTGPRACVSRTERGFH
jgi:hypothetical protein